MANVHTILGNNSRTIDVSTWSELEWYGTAAGGGGGAGAVSAELWTPAELGDLLHHWYDASDATTITETLGDIDAWADKKGSNDLSGGITGTKPEYLATDHDILGGRQTVKYSNTSELQFATDVDLYGKEVHWIEENVNTNGRGFMYLQGGTNEIYANTTTLGYEGGGAMQTNYQSYAFADNDIPGTYTGYVNGLPWLYSWAFPNVLNESRRRLYLNGKCYVHPGVNNAADPILVDTVGGDAISINAYVGEILITDVLSQEDRNKVQGYLFHRWMTQNQAMLLSEYHPYRDNPPMLDNNNRTGCGGGAGEFGSGVIDVSSYTSIEISGGSPGAGAAGSGATAGTDATNTTIVADGTTTILELVGGKGGDGSDTVGLGGTGGTGSGRVDGSPGGKGGTGTIASGGGGMSQGTTAANLTSDLQSIDGTSAKNAAFGAGGGGNIGNNSASDGGHSKLIIWKAN